MTPVAWSATLHHDARARLDDWVPPDRAQARLRNAYRDFLDDHPDAMQRSCAAGHLTGSALVVDPAGARVLLTLHPKVGRWLQLGGHFEPGDAGLRDGALREAREESGITDLRLSVQPMRLDRHRAHCRRDLPPSQWPDHLDVQYLALAPAGARARISAESLDLRWFGLDEVDRLPDVDPAVLVLVDAARTALSG